MAKYLQYIHIIHCIGIDSFSVLIFRILDFVIEGDLCCLILRP